MASTAERSVRVLIVDAGISLEGLARGADDTLASSPDQNRSRRADDRDALAVDAGRCICASRSAGRRLRAIDAGIANQDLAGRADNGHTLSSNKSLTEGADNGKTGAVDAG